MEGIHSHYKATDDRATSLGSPLELATPSRCNQSVVHLASGGKIQRPVHVAAQDRWTEGPEGVEAGFFPEHLPGNGQEGKAAVTVFANGIAEAIPGLGDSLDRRPIVLAAGIGEVPDLFSQVPFERLPGTPRFLLHLFRVFVRQNGVCPAVRADRDARGVHFHNGLPAHRAVFIQSMRR